MCSIYFIICRVIHFVVHACYLKYSQSFLRVHYLEKRLNKKLLSLIWNIWLCIPHATCFHWNFRRRPAAQVLTDYHMGNKRALLCRVKRSNDREFLSLVYYISGDIAVKNCKHSAKIEAHFYKRVTSLRRDRRVMLRYTRTSVSKEYQETFDDSYATTW